MMKSAATPGTSTPPRRIPRACRPGPVPLRLLFALSALLSAAPPALCDPDIAGKLEGAADFRGRPAHALAGRGIADRALSPYDLLRARANRELGLDYLAYYSTLLQQGSEEVVEARALVTQLHAVAHWDLVDDPVLGRGSLGFYFVDVRGFLGKSAGELSEHCDTSLGVNDADVDGAFTALKDLWWEQRFIDERFNVLAGQVELQGLMNANTYADDDTFSFLAQPVATNPATAFVPAGLGAFVETAPSDDWYLSLAFVDAGANGRYPDFESFAQGDYLYAGELGLTPNIEGMGTGVYRLTGFYREATPEAPSAAGMALSFEQDFGDHSALFLRYAAVDEEACDLAQVLGTGIVLRRPLGRARDWLGFAFMWGDLVHGARQNEYGLETFWRLQVTERLEVTPDLQLHFHPGRGDGLSLVGGLRLRIVL
jgi:carbohydrate-selective porin OprB